jgi:16S rRNA (guanine527-N7)-methyltransferase
MELILSEKEKFISLTGASHEALAKLDIYAELLVEWNQKFNLIAPSTVSHIWSRHFLDSAQLLPMIAKDGKTLADLGSGAGFPGLVLSIMGIGNVHLIESTGKKSDFLRAVIERLGLDAIVHQCRVEDLKGFKADILTARALAPLKDLLFLASPLAKKDSLLLFLKGQKADVELTESRKYWMFDCVKTESLSDPSGSILAIRNLKFSLAGQKLRRRAPK